MKSNQFDFISTVEGPWDGFDAFYENFLQNKVVSYFYPEDIGTPMEEKIYKVIIGYIILEGDFLLLTISADGCETFDDLKNDVNHYGVEFIKLSTLLSYSEVRCSPEDQLVDAATLDDNNSDDEDDKDDFDFDDDDDFDDDFKDDDDDFNDDDDEDRFRSLLTTDGQKLYDEIRTGTYEDDDDEDFRTFKNALNDVSKAVKDTYGDSLDSTTEENYDYNYKGFKAILDAEEDDMTANTDDEDPDRPYKKDVKECLSCGAVYNGDIYAGDYCQLCGSKLHHYTLS